MDRNEALARLRSMEVVDEAVPEWINSMAAWALEEIERLTLKLAEAEQRIDTMVDDHTKLLCNCMERISELSEQLKLKDQRIEGLREELKAMREECVTHKIARDARKGQSL